MAFGKGKSKGKPMEAVNDQELPESEDMIKVESWDEWFDMCGAILPEVETYQTRVWNYHDLMLNPVDRDRAFRDRHDREFWRTDPPVTPKQLITSAKIAGGAMVLAFFAGMIAFTMAKKGQVPGIIEAIGASFSEALILAVGCLVGIFVISVVSFVARRMSRISWFKKRNPRMASAMRYIPPRYRNAFCLDTLYLLHREYDVASFSAAIATLDVHIQNNADTYVPIRILFDVPYSQADEAIDAGQAVDLDDDGDPVVTSEALPADIASHTREGVENAEEALDSLIGLENVKKQVRQMKRRIEFYDGNTSGQSGDNVFLLGPAGSGKTEVARILTKIFYDFGYIRKNRIVEVDGEYLKSPYVGQTGERTSAIVQWAMGGILFVDEAYLLFNEKDNNSVGSEATGVLLKAMEDHRDDLIVIFAGYEDAMNRLIASNEGFASRVKHKLYFDMYSPEELTQIFELFLSKAGQHVDKIDPDARELLKSELEAESKLPGFGNARSARNACDALLDIHADRFIEGTEDPANRGIITYGDVEMFVEQQKKKFAADGRNFMATNHIDEGIISSAELRSRTRKGAADWKKAMDSLVGMERVKQELIAFKERADFFRESGIEDSGVTLNLQFVGPAGVGKTTAAAIVASILYDAGYIRENRYLDVNGDFFKASYVGQTGKRTQAILEYSKGMVLFIDEAYLLSASAGSGHDFGAEAIGVIVDAMEKNRGELVILFAGYEREMAQFMSVNSGLASRVASTIHFEPYDMREMMTIFARMCAQRKFKVDSGAWPNVKMAIEAAQARPNFGNARFVRQLSQDAISRHATRFAHGKVSEGNKFVIEAGDIVVEL